MACRAFFDGACEPRNPGGVGTYGVVVIAAGGVRREGGIACEPSPDCTNNVAEYTALMRALELAREAGCAEVEVYGDSQLVVRQMAGQYAVRSGRLAPLHARARELAASFRRVEFRWIPRSRNKVADGLSREAYARYMEAHPELREAFAPYLATEGQRALLRGLGLEAPWHMSRREAQRLLRRLTGRRR